MKRLGATAISCVCAALAAACDPHPPPAEPAALAFVLAPRPAGDRLDRDGSDALELHGGDALDREIGRLQRRVAAARDVVPHLDRLGWAFVAKARRDSDPGYYLLAERCAAAMAEAGADGPEAWLLRGHALHGLHRFEEAERLARALVAARGLSFDHGLLGDVLLDRGDLAAAVDAYQRMADLRPDAHALVRAARVRFLSGDAEGALQAMEAAARATSPRNAESFAWTWSQLASYQLGDGALDAALHSSEVALAAQPDSAAGLLARGRVLLAKGRATTALEPLRRAAIRSPLPDVLWTLAEALRETGRHEEEDLVRARILETGAGTDPRGLALYLASHRIDTERALALARQELAARPDVYSWDAMAWAQAASGRPEEALASMRRALAAGTRDARLFLHAGVIAASAGRPGEAARWLDAADAIRHTLLPSERAELAARLGSPRATSGSS